MALFHRKDTRRKKQKPPKQFPTIDTRKPETIDSLPAVAQLRIAEIHHDLAKLTKIIEPHRLFIQNKYDVTVFVDMNFKISPRPPEPVPEPDKAEQEAK